MSEPAAQSALRPITRLHTIFLLVAASAGAWPRSASRWPRSGSPGWPWACELSIEVLTSYEMAEVVGIGDGYDLGLDLVTA